MERYPIEIVDGVPVNLASGRPILSLDFDGVLHENLKDGVWKGPHVIGGTPVPGAIAFVKEAQLHYQVMVHSTRCSNPEGRAAVTIWLRDNGFPDLELSDTKPPFHIHIDDRTYHFTGEFPTMDTLHAFRPWWHSST
jgi:hypothetical protein